MQWKKTMSGPKVDVFLLLLKSKETQVKALKEMNLDNISTFVQFIQETPYSEERGANSITFSKDSRNFLLVFNA